MGKLLILLLLLLGGSCPGHLPPSPPILQFTFIPPDSHVLTCSLPTEEKVTQVHWREKHENGTYSLIGAQNPQEGDNVQPSYRKKAVLKWDGNMTFMLEITEQGRALCCEMVTYPSGSILESCQTLTDNTGSQNIRTELVGTLLAGGTFTVGSLIILYHICKMKTRRGFILRKGRDRHERLSHNINELSSHLVNGPLHFANVLHHDTSRNVQNLPPRRQLPPKIPPPRNLLHHEALHLRNHTLGENSPQTTQLQKKALLSRNQEPPQYLINDSLQDATQLMDSIYSNINIQRKQNYKMKHLTNSQPTLPFRSQLLHEAPQQGSGQLNTQTLWDIHSSASTHHIISPALSAPSTSFSHHEVEPWCSSRVPINRTQDTNAFSTINPMYHSSTIWATQPR